MSLTEYRQKRRFNRTPEPKPRTALRSGHSFVVQKHAASHLHYDFRLELDGVLKSWAVPKGPNLDPRVKRLAMQVEDHPVDYGRFEGVIPDAEYGGGTVMLWDRGDWEAIGDAREGYRTGRLKFRLQGEKLRGRWMLVRTARKEKNGEQRQWLLFKERDDEARPITKGDVLDESPLSVVSGRSMDEIAHERDWIWNSKQLQPKAQKATANGRKTKTPKVRSDDIGYDGKKRQFAGVRLTSPEKVLYPEQGITKLELAVYYRAVADWILPHLADRPIVLVRCPEGRAKACFYQKHPPAGSPEAFRLIPIRESSATGNYAIVDDLAGLISLAQVSALEVHVWGSRRDKLELPDRLIFDLDPAPDVAWNRVVEAAFQVRQFLQQLGLESFLKTTGGKGLHLVVPVIRKFDWDDVKEFCKNVADLIVRADPKRYTANMSKAARSGKIYIDYLRNGRGATAVAPYSTRALPGAPVSTPLRWDELSAHVRSDRYDIRCLPARLASLPHDPWADLPSTRQGLAEPMRQVKALVR